MDWGGVAEHFMGNFGSCDNPPMILSANAFIFSYVPTGMLSRISRMPITASKSGFKGTIILTDKHSPERGKAAILSGISKYFDAGKIIYYEDTAKVLNELVSLEEEKGAPYIHKVWVQPGENSPYKDEAPVKSTGCDERQTIEEFLQSILDFKQVLLKTPYTCCLNCTDSPLLHFIASHNSKE